MPQIKYHIASIPCIIDATYFDQTKPDSGCTSSDVDFYGETEIEYNVLDRMGYNAPWLKKKITEDLDQEIKNMIEDTYAE